jgi:hypothetical protein
MINPAERGKNKERPLSVRQHEICRWREDVDAELWTTDCGNTFCFIDAGPKENGMTFCCYCGKKLKAGRS